MDTHQIWLWVTVSYLVFSFGCIFLPIISEYYTDRKFEKKYGKHYEIVIRCRNCGVRDKFKIPFGQDIDENLKDEPCERCGKVGTFVRA